MGNCLFKKSSSDRRRELLSLYFSPVYQAPQLLVEHKAKTPEEEYVRYISSSGDEIDKLKFSAFFYHPDYTVGSGIHESCHRISRLSGSRTIPPVGNYTPPRRTNLKYAYSIIAFAVLCKLFFACRNLCLTECQNMVQ